MLRWAVYAMVYLGSALMVYNIYGFVRFARYVRRLQFWAGSDVILHTPVVLLVLFLLGYLAVGIFGQPDLIVAGILFGGSIFVFVMYKLLRGVTRRIVESEQMEARLLAAEETSRAKTSFLASVSHEMRTPMNVILGLDGLALNDPSLRPETRQHLEKIGQSGRHLMGLINNILDMNRIENGAAELKNEVFSLPDALDQVNAIAQTLCDGKGLDYQVSVEEGAAGCYAGDEMQIKKLLLSLLDNAVKYTDAPGTVRLDVTRAPGDGEKTCLRFAVSDTGAGISEEFLPTIFEPFTQEDASATNRYGGSGLSLSVAKNKLDLMGGGIAVESEKNRGSVFTVTIPLQAAECPKRAKLRETLAELSGRRVLLAEDVPENAEIVMDLLELEDVETDHAENGQRALEMFERAEDWHYDAILMDLRMPVMDGLEAARRIRALDRPYAKLVPIIALTANAFESDVKASLGAGMNYHLSKPADAELLYAVLREQITRAELERGNEA